MRVALTLLVALGLVGCAPRPSEPPNVLVIVADAVRGDGLGVNGYPARTTPRIDRLATQGVNFSQAYAHSTWTKPSIATLFTSLYPPQHGVSGGLYDHVLGDEHLTLAEQFRQAGYQTGAVLNQVHLQPKFGFSQGFDQFVAQRGRTAQWLNQKLLEWLDSIDHERPYFAYLHYLDAHWPYTRNARSSRRGFGPIEMDVEPPLRGREQIARWQEEHAASSIEALRARYDREVALIDLAVGRLIDELAARELYDNTVVVVTSDHGEAFLEHGQLQHGFEPYREVTQVPLVIKPPTSWKVARTGVGKTVGLVDLMPTLLELADLPIPEQLRGRSLAPVFRGEELDALPLPTEGGEALGARRGPFSLLRFDDGRLEFFDLRSDPLEQSPSDRCEGPCRALLKTIESYAALAAESEPAAAELSDQDLNELRALGYL